mgnify:CR=1 FL=1
MAKGDVKTVSLVGRTTVKRRFAPAARSRLHKNNAVRASHALALVGGAAVYSETVVKNGAAGADGGDALISFSNDSIHIFQSPVFVNGHAERLPVRSRNVAQGPVFGIGVVQCDPAGDIIGRYTLPSLIVLMPKDRPSMFGWFAQKEIVEELYVGSHQIFYNV